MARKITGKKLIVDVLPKDLAKPLMKKKLKDLTFNDYNAVGKQLHKYSARDPRKWAIETGTMYTQQCGGCFCFC